MMPSVRLFAALLLLASCAGCRLGRYTFEEPIGNRVMEVKSGDRLHFILTEGPKDRWEAESSDDLISFRITHLREEGKADVEVRVHRGFIDSSDVTLLCRRRGQSEPVRHVSLSLWRKVEDDSPWR